MPVSSLRTIHQSAASPHQIAQEVAEQIDASPKQVLSILRSSGIDLAKADPDRIAKTFKAVLALTRQ